MSLLEISSLGQSEPFAVIIPHVGQNSTWSYLKQHEFRVCDLFLWSGLMPSISSKPYALEATYQRYLGPARLAADSLARRGAEGPGRRVARPGLGRTHTILTASASYIINSHVLGIPREESCDDGLWARRWPRETIVRICVRFWTPSELARRDGGESIVEQGALKSIFFGLQSYSSVI